MANKVFTRSDNFKSEYSCAVVRIGELIDIEGSDFLAKTNILGTQIVVRKDMLKTNDLVLYAANETQLNEEFLSRNNLFEIGCREKNANAEEVERIMKPYRELQAKAEPLRNKVAKLRDATKSAKKQTLKEEKIISKLNDKYSKLTDGDDNKIVVKNQIEDKTLLVETLLSKQKNYAATIEELKLQIAAIVKEGEQIVAEAKKHCGFFNKYGRVRCVKLRNVPSFGFLFGLDAVQRLYPQVTEQDLLDCEGEEFDTICGELFVRAYVPPVKEVKHSKSKTSKAQKKIDGFDRMVEGEFELHYTTEQLQKNMHKFKPEDVVDITVKMHGTSVVIGNLRVKTPKKIAWWKTLANKVFKFFKKDKPFIDYEIGYGPVYSSRKVIRNQYINENVGNGFYNFDIWNYWGEIIYPYLEKGMTVYGEIFGHMPNGDGTGYIQKHYDYGCENGQSKLMIYRITTTMNDCKRYEWEIPEICEWTQKLIKTMKNVSDPNAENIHPINVLYQGSLGDLYEDIDTEHHWNKSLLERMRNDKERFGMEEDEPMCRNSVPREGICLRKRRDEDNECFKLKTISYALFEANEMDEGYNDIEMMQNDYLGEIQDEI